MQLVRFFFKRDVQQKSKILRKVDPSLNPYNQSLLHYWSGNPSKYTFSFHSELSLIMIPVIPGLQREFLDLQSFLNKNILAKIVPISLTQWWLRWEVFLNQVNFPTVLDCYEFCSDEYKKELDAPREAYQQVEDKKAGIEKQKKDAARKEAEAKEQAASKSTRKRPLPSKVCKTETSFYTSCLDSSVWPTPVICTPCSTSCALANLSSGWLIPLGNVQCRVCLKGDKCCHESACFGDSLLWETISMFQRGKYTWDRGPCCPSC